MPFYEYQCKNCGHELEAMQKVSDAPLKKCPHCGKSQLQRLISAPVFRLKGAGWYETDFKKDQDKKRNLAEHPDAGAPKESEKTSDAKAAETKGEDSAASKSETSAKSAELPSEKTAKSTVKSKQRARRAAKPAAHRRRKG